MKFCQTIYAVQRLETEVRVLHANVAALCADIASLRDYIAVLEQSQQSVLRSPSRAFSVSGAKGPRAECYGCGLLVEVTAMVAHASERYHPGCVPDTEPVCEGCHGSFGSDDAYTGPGRSGIFHARCLPDTEAE